MRLIDADSIEFARSENGCAEDYVTRYDINEMPTIESPRPDWTPCAEGLPEDLPGYQPMSRYECTILIPDGTREVFTLHRTGNGRWLYETGKGLDAVHGDQVVAWRKVSDPYNPDQFREPTKMMQNDM